MTKREIIIIGFFYSSLISIALVIILKNVNAGNISEIIQAVTGVFTLLLTLGAVLYAYKAFKEQKRQNDNNEIQIKKNNEDVEFNRVLDLVYRQLELSLPVIKNKRFDYLSKLFYDVEMDDKEIVVDIETFEFELIDYLESVESQIENLIFILEENSLKDKTKIYLKKLICNNLNNDFFYVFLRFEELVKRFKINRMDYLSRLDNILKIKQEIV